MFPRFRAYGRVSAFTVSGLKISGFNGFKASEFGGSVFRGCRFVKFLSSS